MLRYRIATFVAVFGFFAVYAATALAGDGGGWGP
jgi:hypothetical protein